MGLRQISRHGSVLDGIRALPPFKATGQRGFAPGGPSCPGTRVWGLSPRAFLCSCGHEGEGHSISTLLHGGKGHAPSLTILEGMDVAKNPQPIVLPLGRHSQLLHRGAGLPRRRAWITSFTLSQAPTPPAHSGPHSPLGITTPSQTRQAKVLRTSLGDPGRDGWTLPPILSRDSRGERAGSGGSSSGA